MTHGDVAMSDQLPGSTPLQARGPISKFAGIIVSRERLFDVLSTIITAVFTVVLALSTVLLWKETKDLRNFAAKQSEDMKESIREAARAADAMQNVAKAVELSAKVGNDGVALSKDSYVRMLRAYLTVGFGTVFKQDNATNTRFEVRMNVQNVGNTPAYKVVTQTYVDALPFPLPSDFQFPKLDDRGSSSTLGPHDGGVVSGIAERFYSDDEIKEFELGTTKHLYIYGLVAYEDAFGIRRETNFCKALVYLKNGNFMTLNTSNYNDAD